MDRAESVNTGGVGREGRVVTAVFHDVQGAGAAIRELRELDLPAENISVISRDEGGTDGAAAAGVSREETGDESLAYRASPELPNYEDLPTTIGEQIGEPVSLATAETATEGGDARVGLSADSDMVRRNEAETNADIDIYTDFPDKLGGVNPDSPVASEPEDTVQEAVKGRTPAAGSAATGATLGGLSGLLAGLGLIAVPGIGPILAAGPLAGALGGVLAGGAAGGLIGGLSGIGVPQEYARDYAAHIEQGSTLVSVRTDDVTCDAVERVLIANGGENVHGS